MEEERECTIHLNTYNQVYITTRASGVTTGGNRSKGEGGPGAPYQNLVS